MGNRVVVFAAHPDDEVLGCGGVIAGFAKLGYAVSIIILGEGITSRYDDRKDVDSALIKNLGNTSREVAKYLGAHKVKNCGLPDNRFDTVPMLDIVKIIEKEISELTPEIIFTHHWSDLNIDHTIVSRATVTAARPLFVKGLKRIYSYEVPSSTDWSFRATKAVFQPNVFFDISSTLEHKIKAMKMYESELREFPHPRSVMSMECNAKRWGGVAGICYAEAFELMREIIEL